MRTRKCGVLDDGVAGDAPEIGADERELLRVIHLLDLIKPVDRLLAEEIAADAVDGVGRIADDLAGLERFGGAPDLARLRVHRIDGKQHGRAGRLADLEPSLKLDRFAACARSAPGRRRVAPSSRHSCRLSSNTSVSKARRCNVNVASSFDAVGLMRKSTRGRFPASSCTVIDSVAGAIVQTGKSKAPMAASTRAAMAASSDVRVRSHHRHDLETRCVERLGEGPERAVARGYARSDGDARASQRDGGGAPPKGPARRRPR